MNSRVVGIIKFETPRMNGREGDLVLNSAGDEGLSLQRWLAALVGEVTDEQGPSPRWPARPGIASPLRRVRANLEQLAEELDREYLALGQ